jgi:hypothetical protein
VTPIGPSPLSPLQELKRLSLELEAARGEPSMPRLGSPTKPSRQHAFSIAVRPSSDADEGIKSAELVAQQVNRRRLSILFLAALAFVMLATLATVLLLPNDTTPPSPPVVAPPAEAPPPPPSPPPAEESLLFDVRFAALDIAQFADAAFDAAFRSNFRASIALVRVPTSLPHDHCAGENNTHAHHTRENRTTGETNCLQRSVRSGSASHPQGGPATGRERTKERPSPPPKYHLLASSPQTAP